MKELEYPFDNGFIMKKKRSLKRQLLGDGAVRLKKRVAVLGGSTTDDIVSVWLQGEYNTYFFKSYIQL